MGCARARCWGLPVRHQTGFCSRQFVHHTRICLFAILSCMCGCLTGSILISVDPVKGDTQGDSTSAAAIGGDLILISSAALWSMVMVRQSKHAPYFSPVTLATVKVSSKTSNKISTHTFCIVCRQLFWGQFRSVQHICSK